MKARDIMTPDPEVVTPEEPISRAAKIMRDYDVGLVPVVSTTDSWNLVGLITDLLRDLDACQLACERLNSRLNAQASEWQSLFDKIPVASVTTDPHGMILNANRSAALLLNLSVKHLTNRLLLHFAEDRDAFTGTLQAVRVERIQLRTSLVLRPRERAPLETQVIVIPEVQAGIGTLWLWFLLPRGPKPTVCPQGAPRPVNDENAARSPLVDERAGNQARHQRGGSTEARARHSTICDEPTPTRQALMSNRRA